MGLQGEKLVERFRGVVLFVIDGKEFMVDLKTGQGRATEGRFDDLEEDITVTTSDENFAKLASGSLNPQSAFLSGKIKIQGSMALAMKLQPVMSALGPQAKL